MRANHAEIDPIFIQCIIMLVSKTICFVIAHFTRLSPTHSSSLHAGCESRYGFGS
jgi:hypothetical protein